MTRRHSSTLELQHAGARHATRTRRRNTARGLFRIAFPDALTQTSTFRISDGRVVPQYVHAASDEKERRDRPRLRLADTKRVTGIAEDKPVDLRAAPGVQDAMSVQIASLRSCSPAARLQGTVWMIDKNKVKEYCTRTKARRASTPRSASSTR